MEILSKSHLERCARDSGAGGRLTCDRKIVFNLAVPSGSSGGESSLVAQVVEVEENDTQEMQTIRDPPVITINKSAAYAFYAINYIRDVAYRPEEQFARTRKCESDAGAEVTKYCERLRDQNGHIIEHTEESKGTMGTEKKNPRKRLFSDGNTSSEDTAGKKQKRDELCGNKDKTFLKRPKNVDRQQSFHLCFSAKGNRYVVQDKKTRAFVPPM